MWVSLVLVPAVIAKVVFVTEVCRHGARAPGDDSICTWDQDGRWGNAWNELDSVGMRQHFLLGSELRQRYILTQPAFGLTYNSTQIYVQSTDYNRTIMSAQSQLMGLFPPTSGPTLPLSMGTVAVPPINVKHVVDYVSDLEQRALPQQYQPSSVHVVPVTEDWLLFATYTCDQLIAQIQKPVYDQLAYNISHSNPHLLAASQPFFPHLSLDEIAGNISDIADSVVCNSAMGFPLPEFPPGMEENLTIVANQLFSMYYQDDLLVRYFSSWFFTDLAQHLEAVMTGDEPTKFRLYSAHDGTVAAFLAGLQVRDSTQPPFASTLLFEVSEDAGVFTIKVLYNDQPLTIGPCPSHMCPLKTFIDYLYMRSFPSQEVCSSQTTAPWKNLTEGNTHSIKPKSGSSWLKWEAWVTIAFCVFALLVGVAALIVCKSKKVETLYSQMDDFGSSSHTVPQMKVVNFVRP